MYRVYSEGPAFQLGEHCLLGVSVCAFELKCNHEIGGSRSLYFD